MKRAKVIFFFLGVIAIAGNQKAFAQYTGGTNDGFSDSYQCAINLSGNPAFSIGAVVGSSTFCSFATETYSITAAGGTVNTTYVWTVPAGASIASGQGTNTILVTFGSTNGNISVNVADDCQTLSAALAVSSTNCVFYTGGSNDGFSDSYQCAITLSGNPAFSIGPIVGSSTFCSFATETYSITATGGTVNTTYVWTVPAGASIASGQGTNTVLVTFGITNGNISVNVADDCQTLSGALAVSSTNCIFYAGGSNDGFSDITDCATNLNGGSVFIPGPIIGSTTFCNFATEAYSITVAGTTSTTGYNWTVPAGATVTSGQGTNSILVTFGNTSGNVSVDVSNACQLITVSLAVTTTNCIFYAGGINDGFSDITDCATNLNGGSVFSPGPIVGSTTFCNFATEAYSITVAGATASTGYNWSVPVGATVTSGQGTSSVLVTFGNTNGNVSVDVSNACQTITVSQAVVATNCIFYAGGLNDGFSDVTDCSTSLNGGSGFVAGPVIGSTTFCNFSTEAYSVTIAGATSTTVYNWTVPAGATVTSGQGTNAVLVTFGSTNGSVTVTATNSCSTVVSSSLAVSSTNCIFYTGGPNDGFSVTLVSNIPLPIQLILFEAEVVNGKVELTWVTASELNNSYFTVERSKDGQDFEAIHSVDGAGTSAVRHEYHAEDLNPYLGKSYYRLSQTDVNGNTTHSWLVLVNVNSDLLGVISLFPNPVSKMQTVTIKYMSSMAGYLKMSLLDISGKTMIMDTRDLQAGENELEVTLPLESAGIYILQLRGPDKNENIRIAVE